MYCTAWLHLHAADRKLVKRHPLRCGTSLPCGTLWSRLHACGALPSGRSLSARHAPLQFWFLSHSLQRQAMFCLLHQRFCFWGLIASFGC